MRLIALLVSLVAAAGAPPADEVARRFDHAAALQARGAFEEAEAEYRALVRDAPRLAEAHANLGAVLSRLGRHDEAVASYQEALRIDPGLSAVRLNLGIAHFRAGWLKKAADDLESYLSAEPASLQAHQLLGMVLVEMDRSAEGALHLEKALVAGPEDAALLYALGRAYVRLRSPALPSVLERLAALPSGPALAHLLQALLLMEKTEYRSALEEAEAAERLNPELPELHVTAGLAYLRLGLFPEAARRFEKERERAPRDARSLYYLAFIDAQEGRPERAAERLRALLEIDPDSVEANALLGKVLLDRGRPREAAEVLECAVAGDSRDSGKHFLLARAYQRLGRAQEAAREFAETQRLKEEALEAERHPRRRP